MSTVVRMVVFVLFAVILIQAKDLPKPIDKATATETLSPAGTIHLETPRGEVTIEGWDFPKVEITVTKSGRLIEHARIKSERTGEEIVISTEIPSRDRREVTVEYGIKAPRDSKIVIDGTEGGVYVTGIAGDVQASIRRGQITLALPDSAYQIDAETKLGDVYSDIEGTDRRRRWIGHDFAGGAPASTHKLYLRVGIGDIVIMKAYPRPEIAK
jgi:hypothetical protein